MKIRREECLIIGCMRAARGGAAFARAPLVLECHGERYIVRRISQAELVEGEPMRDDEWRGVLLSEEALELSNYQQARPNTLIWLLRSNFSFREEAMATLERRGAVLYKEMQEETQVLLVDEVVASGLPDQWSAQAWHQAWAHASAGQMGQAVEQAELSMCLARGFLADHVALLSLLYERRGDDEQAEAMLAVARNSRGDAFHEDVCKRKACFAEKLSIVSASAPRRPRFGPKASPPRSNALQASFDRFHERDAA
jgi:hypothetical protein